MDSTIAVWNWINTACGRSLEPGNLNDSTNVTAAADEWREGYRVFSGFKGV